MKIFLFVLTVLFVSCDNINRNKTNYVDDNYSRLERIDQKTNRASNFEDAFKSMTSPIIVISTKLKILENKKIISIACKNNSLKTINLLSFQCFGNDINGFRSIIEESQKSNQEFQFLKPNEIGEISFLIDSEND